LPSPNRDANVDKFDIESLLRSGRETQGIEFKGPMSWASTATQSKVIRAALAMANRRDGGLLIFGLEPPTEPGPHRLVGLADEEWRSFTQDGVSAVVNSHVVPHLEVLVDHVVVEGHKLVLVTISEFSDYPAICSRDVVVNGRTIVRRGGLYCRSRRMAESTEVQSPDDMRDIIDLAVAKGLERYFRLRSIETESGPSSATEQFDSQLGELRR
jgi:predicted HTH transcriptional regulator